jgi:alpha-tubulin suppressor-like RCC1 family protein
MGRRRGLLLIGVAVAALVGTQGTAASAADAPRTVALDEARGTSVAPISLEEARRLSTSAAPQGAPNARTAPAAQASIGSGGSEFRAFSPMRVLDTRTGGFPIGPGALVAVYLRHDVPVDATAVVLNVTGVKPTENTYVTAWPSQIERPDVSNLNLRAGEIRANAATVALGNDRNVSFYNHSGKTDIAVDLLGYYVPTGGSRFTAQSPVRVLDTRTSGGALGAGATRDIDLSSRVPATATSVTFNLTGASATASTFVTAWPSGTDRPTASSLNLKPGQITPNQVTVALGADRKVSLYNSAGNTHLIADLAGYYATDRGNPFFQMRPVRVRDTRLGHPLPGGFSGDVDTSPDLPASAAAVTFNLTGTGPTKSTYLTAFPTGSAVPTASNLNLTAGQTAANLVTVAIGKNRSVSVFNQQGNTDFLMDVAGYFAPPPAACATACLSSWGENYDGQLGVGTTGGESTRPGRVDGLTGATAVTGGFFNGYALRGDGTVVAWGTNDLYGLGNGRAHGSSTVPARVGQLAGVTQLAAGAYNGYALDNTHRVWAWGYNGDGSVGDGSVSGRTSPVAVALPADVNQVAAGFTTGYALRADGTVWAWGANGGALGNGVYGTGCGTVPVGAGCRATSPVKVSGLTGVVSIAATRNAAFAVKADGTVWAWGWNARGELGLGTQGGTAECDANPTGPNCVQLTPVQIPGLTGVAKVASGTVATTYALKTDGTVLSWGWSGSGQLGNGQFSEPCPFPNSPVDCSRLTPGPVLTLTGIVDVAGGTDHGMALKSDGTVWTWGDNSHGQLGGGALLYEPGREPNLSGVTAIGTGGTTSYAIS